MVIAGIVAGGTGSRMGDALPKQFTCLCGKPIIIHTVEKFLNHRGIDGIIIGVTPEWLDYCNELKSACFSGNNRIITVAGGYDRNATVNNIAEAAADFFGASDNDILVTHDAVRPFVTDVMISENIQTAAAHGVCTTAIGATDTIACSEDGTNISELPIRNTMYQVQTPQTFKLGDFKRVYATMKRSELDTVTDVCKMFKCRNYNVKLVKGCVSNIKITYPLDMKIAEIICLGTVK